MANIKLLNSLTEIAHKGQEAGIIHLNAQAVSANSFRSKSKTYTNFGSCSYLGLEFDERVRAGALKAISDFGTQFSSSRAYVSCGLYEQLENQLSSVFGAHAIAMPTTTLGHIATLPVIIGDNDAIIIDHQTHSSVQTAVQLLRARGIKVDMIRHSRMDILEERIERYAKEKDKVWYLGDGVYSMYGDKAPMDELYDMLNRHPSFHLYLDDAHAMCCYGSRGQGYVLENREMHQRLVLATSLNKAFAAGGGVIVTADEKMYRDIRNCGGPLITSGPMQPASLGAANVVAGILLSDEIALRQQELKERILYANMLIKKVGLPLIAENDTSVFFIGVGLPRVGYNVVQRLMNAGFFTNIGIFPAVPIKNTGIRFTITSLSSFEDIRNLVAAIAQELPRALDDENYSIQEVRKAFGLASEEDVVYERINSLMKTAGLKIETAQSIDQVNQQEWNHLFKGRGMMDTDTLRLLEQSYSSENALPENRWDFDYLIIRDEKKKPILATFLSTSLVKDDFLSDAKVSAHVESIRQKQDPYYLTSRVLSMGCGLTLGRHLYIDRSSSKWREAFERCLEYILSLQEERKAESIMLRDFYHDDVDLKEMILDYGFFNLDFPDDHVLDIRDFDTMENYVKALSTKGRRHIRDTVKKNDNFTVHLVQEADSTKVKEWFNLMQNVKSKNLSINTFKTKAEFFARLIAHDEYEAIELRALKGDLVAVIINHHNGASYDPLYIGMDYEYLDQGIYRKSLYHSIARGMNLGCQEVGLGFTAAFEKKRLGAKSRPIQAYALTKEHYNLEVLSAIEHYEQI